MKIPNLDERFNPVFCRPLEHHHPHHHLHQQHLSPATTTNHSSTLPSSTTHAGSYTTTHSGSPHAYTLSKTQAHVHTINDNPTYLTQTTLTSDSTSNNRTNNTNNTLNNKHHHQQQHQQHQQHQKGGGVSVIHAHHHHAHNHHHHAHGHTLMPCDGGVGSRLSRSVEDLPTDIQDHILRCQCSCDHLGYGNFSVSE
ncbi:hypothetical protein Pmani_038526 [Petrolisthes manimaculis]|uniref:Uncharacterized protein n=1 Tax=Petrolisthes manimaculis TaxID=1843537 RepID=A0AAE1NG01_9EUCA|nr:hypothetical protein Pmani_038526 [Petrolisthes manimaculis]